jgi:hypothetical protein
MRTNSSKFLTQTGGVFHVGTTATHWQSFVLNMIANSFNFIETVFSMLKWDISVSIVYIS